MSDDYYEILGVEPDATNKEIKQAYKKLAVKWHPDKHKNKDKAENKFKDIAEAYQVLIDPEKREIYDIYGKNGLNDDNDPFTDFNDIFSGEDFKNGGFNPQNIFGDDKSGGLSPDELFEQFFKIKSPFGPGSEFNKIFNDPSKINNQTYSKENDMNRKGETIEYDLNCTLEDLYKGKNKKFRIKRKVYDGKTQQTETDHLEIKIEPGWKDGTKMTYENMGDVMPNIIPGDIVFIIKELPHNIYKRVSNDLEVECSITLDEALQGFTRTLKTFNGETEIIKINSLKKSNQIYTLTGLGMPIRKNKRVVGYGDIIIKFYIEFNKISNKNKKLIANVLGK